MGKCSPSQFAYLPMMKEATKETASKVKTAVLSTTNKAKARAKKDMKDDDKKDGDEKKDGDAKMEDASTEKKQDAPDKDECADKKESAEAKDGTTSASADSIDVDSKSK